jgi:hypothetical protein
LSSSIPQIEEEAREVIKNNVVKIFNMVKNLLKIRVCPQFEWE